MKREEIIRDLSERSAGAGADQYMAIRCDVAREIVRMLKEQEPRVMTLEEANETLMHGDFVIMEDRETDMIWLGMRGDDNIDLASGEYFDFDDLEKQEYRHEYGRSFRFWTSRPTDEQRKAVKWNE